MSNSRGRLGTVFGNAPKEIVGDIKLTRPVGWMLTSQFCKTTIKLKNKLYLRIVYIDLIKWTGVGHVIEVFHWGISPLNFGDNRSKYVD